MTRCNLQFNYDIFHDEWYFSEISLTDLTTVIIYLFVWFDNKSTSQQIKQDTIMQVYNSHRFNSNSNGNRK